MFQVMLVGILQRQLAKKEDSGSQRVVIQIRDPEQPHEDHYDRKYYPFGHGVTSAQRAGSGTPGQWCPLAN